MFLILTPLLKNTNKNRIVHSKILVSPGIRPGNTKTAGGLIKSRLPAKKIERVMGIEPTYPAWKAGVLPLNYTRMFIYEAGRPFL